MNTWPVKIVALLVSGFLWGSSALAPVLAILQDGEPPKSEPVPAAGGVETSPPARSEQAEKPSEKGDQTPEQDAWAGSGLSDLMNREQRSLKPSLIISLSNSHVGAPSSSADHPRRFMHSSRLRFVRYDWGQRAHWPCGPPVA